MWGNCCTTDWANRWSTLTEQRKYKSHARDLFAYKSSCVTTSPVMKRSCKLDKHGSCPTRHLSIYAHHGDYGDDSAHFYRQESHFLEVSSSDYWGLCWPERGGLELSSMSSSQRSPRWTFTVVAFAGESWVSQLLLYNLNTSEEKTMEFVHVKWRWDWLFSVNI